jgi:hypothetical protein
MGKTKRKRVLKHSYSKSRNIFSCIATHPTWNPGLQYTIYKERLKQIKHVNEKRIYGRNSRSISSRNILQRIIMKKICNNYLTLS